MPTSRPIITLTTDFGVGSPYVAEMKGVIWSLAPEVRIVDVTHGIRPQDVREGAQVLRQVCPRFPPETIHVAVVDPGVGSARPLVYAELGEQRLLAPDNGLLSLLAVAQPVTRMRTIVEPSLWLPEVSRTFHGRDILAPVAARLALGLPPERLGPAHPALLSLSWPEVQIVPGKIVGTVSRIDSFGNLITDIPRSALANVPAGPETRIACGDHETFGIFQTYADQPPLTLIALFGSSDVLELAIVDDSAALMLGIKTGEKVTVTW